MKEPYIFIILAALYLLLLVSVFYIVKELIREVRRLQQSHSQAKSLTERLNIRFNSMSNILQCSMILFPLILLVFTAPAIIREEFKSLEHEENTVAFQRDIVSDKKHQLNESRLEPLAKDTKAYAREGAKEEKRSNEKKEKAYQGPLMTVLGLVGVLYALKETGVIVLADIFENHDDKKLVKELN